MLTAVAQNLSEPSMPTNAPSAKPTAAPGGPRMAPPVTAPVTAPAVMFAPVATSKVRCELAVGVGVGGVGAGGGKGCTFVFMPGACWASVVLAGDGNAVTSSTTPPFRRHATTATLVSTTTWR